MNRLAQKNILLGISGGIAAYKSADLVRRLRDHGANVRVVMTAGASEFITPLTLQALSANPVHCDLLDTSSEAAMGHIELSRWADAILVAPASANCLARIAHGHADDLLTTLILASTAPLIVAPAMNQAMWRHLATQANIGILQQRAVQIFGPASGSQACGDTGPGRMLEAEELARRLGAYLDGALADASLGDNAPGNNAASGDALLANVHVAITAGPTREAIDPVRYISNHSSGKMGYAMARAALAAGAKTTLISGPVALPSPQGATVHSVISAQEMYQHCLEVAPTCDIFIATAAVADYRPQQSAPQKIKKSQDDMLLQLVRNPDIISTIAQLNSAPYCVGFAAETEHVTAHAKAKLHNKQLDMVIANDVSDDLIGFNSDENRVTVLTHDEELSFAQTSKEQLASLLIEKIATKFMASRPL